MKQVILVRKDLGLSRGKLSSQVAHASVEAVLQSDRKVVEAWREQGMKKVVLVVKDESELLEVHRFAREAGLVSVVVTDAGRTEVEPGTVTCVGIGPAADEKVDGVTGKLKAL